MKTLIFGPSNAGKTSLMRTVSQGYSFVRVIDLPPTRGISRENYLFRGLLEITIWDAGGQEKYMDRYFSEGQKEAIFSDVEIPVFMIDSTAMEQRHTEFFKQFLHNILEFSPNIHAIYIFFNKVDLPLAQPDLILHEFRNILPPRAKEICKFTSVSVKEGSAQAQLIEILDNALQNSVKELEKIAKIRNFLELMKAQTGCEYIVFNRPDGLITTSTFGEIKTEPLNFLSMDIGSLESNIDSIFSKMMNKLGKPINALHLSSMIYETQENYLILREIGDFAMLMAISNKKSIEVLGKIFTQIDSSNPTMNELNKILKHR
jgi:GTPase SAR1 family protein